MDESAEVARLKEEIRRLRLEIERLRDLLIRAGWPLT
jgi:transcription initiation factor IIE alpha subunit